MLPDGTRAVVVGPHNGWAETGHAPEPWRDALQQEQQPSQKEARAALMMPGDDAPSAGQGPSASTITGGSAGSPGPIGATTQTMPAKFSRRNDVLDKVPTMAWPLPLNEQQRKQIYKAVMSDSSQPVDGAAALKPGSFLTYEETRDEHTLPQAVAGIDGPQGLKYVKGNNKVLLVRPPNGIVVDEIAM
jgi:hypothetical protein